MWMQMLSTIEKNAFGNDSEGMGRRGWCLKKSSEQANVTEFIKKTGIYL